MSMSATNSPRTPTHAVYSQQHHIDGGLLQIHRQRLADQ